MAEYLFFVIIILVLLNYIISELLKYYNNTWRRKPIPTALKDVYTYDRYITYLNYKKESYRFSVITSTFSLTLILIMLFGGFALVDNWLRGLVSNEIFISILFFGIIALASDILSMPFDIYETFIIEQKYGFNTTTLKTYLLDKLKSYFLAIIIGLPVLYLIIWLYGKFGADFWWFVWMIIAAISIAISVLYSNLIVPLFNKQTLLADGGLREEIKKLSEKTDFKLDNIFVIDGSKRSTRANAYFTGLGSRKRIVLYDTLIATLSQDEIVSVLAHEIGHYQKKHTMIGLITSILQTGLLLFLFSLIIENPVIFDALGTKPGFHLGMIVFIILYSPVSFIISFGLNYISRKHEFEADYFAVVHTSGESLITALKSLTSNNLSDLNPNPWFAKAYYSHPPLVQRIGAINARMKEKMVKSGGLNIELN